MHICVIGDSWGGNVDCNYGVFSRLFDKFGHSITNISAGGASNQGQLRNLEFQKLDKGNTFDCVIWIYTEPARDFTEFVSLDYGNDTKAAAELFPDLTYLDFDLDLKYIANQNFKCAQRLFEKYKIPFVVIGGAGVVDKDIDNYTFSLSTMHSWNQVISQLDSMPVNCYTHHVVKMADFAKYDKLAVLTELNKIEILEKTMKSDIRKYPDHLHPAVDLYTELVEFIISQFELKGIQ